MASEKVEIKIVVDKQTGALSVAGQELDAFGTKTEAAERRMTLAQIEANKMNEAFGVSKDATVGLAGALTGLVAAGAVFEFLKSAVEESMREAEALRVLRGSVESTGASWDKYKDIIQEFAKVQQETTRFQDDQVYDTLGRLARSTDNVAQAMRATTLAQDLAVKSGRSLAETTELVNQLLLGQERSVKLATKEYGNLAGGATTAQQALHNLEESTKGAAAAERGAVKDTAQLNAIWGDTKQVLGDLLAPALVIATSELRDFLKELQTGFGLFAKEKTAHEERVANLKTERDALIASQAELQHYGIYTKEQVEKNYQLREAIKAKNEELEKEKSLNSQAAGPQGDSSELRARQDVAAAQQSADKRREIEKNLSDEVNQQINDQFEYKRLKLDEEVAAAKQAGVDKLQVMIDGQVQELDLDSFKSIRQLQIAQEQAAAISEIDRKGLEQKAKNEKQQQELEKIRKANFQSTLEFISSLSTAKNKELALIGKAAGLANAYINTGVAVTRALAAAPPPFNFALAAAVGAAGAAQIATIAGVQLEGGGVTEGLSSEGILANIGEKRKKEGVLPLENPKAMRAVAQAIAEQSDGGTGNGVVVSFGDINISISAVDLQDPARIREIAIGLANEIRSETEEAIVLSRRSFDLHDKNKERAA